MRTILGLLIFACAAFCARPTGTYDFLAHANITGDAETNTILTVPGTLHGGRCHYVGKIDLPARDGKCQDVMVLHLTVIEGDAGGLTCTYDRSIFGDFLLVNRVKRSHCPDLLAAEFGTFRVLGEYDFGRDDNQADYWVPGMEYTFDYHIDAGYLNGTKSLREQVMYRYRYDWVGRRQYAR